MEAVLENYLSVKIDQVEVFPPFLYFDKPSGLVVFEDNLQFWRCGLGVEEDLGVTLLPHQLQPFHNRNNVVDYVVVLFS